MRNQLTSLISNLPSFREHFFAEMMNYFYSRYQLKVGRMGKPAFSPNLVNLISNSPFLSLIARQEKVCRIQKETVNNITNKIKVEKQEYYQLNLVNIRSNLTCQHCRRNHINIEQSFSFYLSLSDLCLISIHVFLLILLANVPVSSSISILITAQKMKFSVKDIFPADLIKFYDEILNRKL